VTAAPERLARSHDELAQAIADGAGAEVTSGSAYGVPCVDVPATAWVAALTHARDALGFTFFDWLSAVDELDEGFSVVVHLYDLGTGEGLLVRTRVPLEAARLPTATGVFAGAAWHERETHEMFGIGFDGHPHLEPLLLPDGFEGTPLRKSFVLASRAAKPWPGAKEPGESDAGGGSPSRRKTLPPGVPPASWGPRLPPGVADELPPGADAETAAQPSPGAQSAPEGQ
jgi:NADH:ubiquinone oxidoreductase subunit C